MLTTQQVHENNVAAKKVLKEVYEELAKIKADKIARKSLPMWLRVLSFVFGGAEEATKQLYYQSFYTQVKNSLELYFKMHYTGENYSNYYSPVVQFSYTKDNILWHTIYTKKIDVIPHPHSL